MPLGKYYCDYCDKQFQDTPAARRRHLQGVVHQRAKALWYDAFRNSSFQDLDPILDPQLIGKGVCNRFVRTGSCQFGDSCKYYHPKKNEPDMNLKVMEGTNFINNVQSLGGPGSHLLREVSVPALTFGNQMCASLGNLPPSLWPPPEGGYPPLPLIDWG